MIVRLTLCLLLINAAIGKVEDVKVNVLQSDGTVIQSLTAGSDKQPLQLPVIDHTQQLQVIVNAEQVFTSTFAEKLHIPFDVQVLFTLGTSNSRPEQVVLRLVNQRSPDTAAYFTISASNGEYSISIKPDAVQRQTGAGKGVWHAAVLLGSSTASTLTTIPIGSVEFKYSPLDDGSQPPEGIRAIDTVSTPKIDMPYVFRPDQKQISAIISVPFAALAVVPTLALFRLLSQQTQAIDAQSLSPSKLAFHGGLLAILVLNVVFWLGVPLLEVLVWLTGLGLFTTVSWFISLRQATATDAPSFASGKKTD